MNIPLGNFEINPTGPAEKLGLQTEVSGQDKARVAEVTRRFKRTFLTDDGKWVLNYLLERYVDVEEEVMRYPRTMDEILTNHSISLCRKTRKDLINEIAAEVFKDMEPPDAE